MPSMVPVVIAVEGLSDRLVLELLARRRGRDLEAEGIEIVSIGGAHAIGRFVAELPPDTALRGLCDANEAYLFRRVLDDVYVCAPDLEGELIRSLGVEAVQSIIADAGGLRSFRKFQHQPAQRGRPLEAQLDRWLRSGSSRYKRYLRLLVEALDLDQVPQPLDKVLEDG
jgi:nucleotidyltransferase/DNA polymerase involved in DNA repair